MFVRVGRLDPRTNDLCVPHEWRWLNSDHIVGFHLTQSGFVEVALSTGETTLVDAGAEHLARALNPDRCADPSDCAYVSHYLAYGGPDLTHAGFHAAERLAQAHAATCTRYEDGATCPACEDHEARLRA